MEQPTINRGPYDFELPVGRELLGPVMQLASGYLETFDIAVSGWCEVAPAAQKTTLNGVLIGFGRRARSSLRSMQVLVGHNLVTDAVSASRPVVEALIYAKYITSDGDGTRRAKLFEDFQWVERMREVEVIRGLGRGADLKPEKIREIERQYAAVSGQFVGKDLDRKKMFSVNGTGVGLRGLARACGPSIASIYETAFGPASVFSHITSQSVVGSDDPLLGITIGTVCFDRLLRVLDETLQLKLARALDGLDAEYAKALGKAQSEGA